MIETKTLKYYFRQYGIPYAYNKKFLYAPGTTLCGEQCFWQFSIKCGIITDCCILFKMPDTPIKKCYDQMPWQNSLKQIKCDKIMKLIHISYNHTVEQMIVVC